MNKSARVKATSSSPRDTAAAEESEAEDDAVDLSGGEEGEAPELQNLRWLDTSAGLAPREADILAVERIEAGRRKKKFDKTEGARRASTKKEERSKLLQDAREVLITQVRADPDGA
ncbi:hypothetical protein B484DRAFT_404185 [Ochromonadaceae sp. CCMP2298]|nr:hypothetical protein B484DRAFT_404185 [Ochromonadaceae sp. CCMP2298]